MNTTGTFFYTSKVYKHHGYVYKIAIHHSYVWGYLTKFLEHYIQVNNDRCNKVYELWIPGLNNVWFLQKNIKILRDTYKELSPL